MNKVSLIAAGLAIPKYTIDDTLGNVVDYSDIKYCFESKSDDGEMEEDVTAFTAESYVIDKASLENDSINQRSSVMKLCFVLLGWGVISSASYIVLNEENKGCSDVILCAQYIFCTAEGLASGGLNDYVTNRKIPMRFHLLFVSLFGIGNLLYSWSLQLGLPMPAHIVIKNSGVSITMALGHFLLQKKYQSNQFLAVVIITVGILLTTFASQPENINVDTNSAMLLPAVLLVVGVMSQCLLNVTQERVFGEYGKHFQETIFFQHFLGLPMFAIKYYSILLYGSMWTLKHWFFLVANIITTYLMKLTCLKLTAESSSMVCVLVVTVNRFLSLIVSAFIVLPPRFPLQLLVGGILVMGGTSLYVCSGRKEAKLKKS